jgi:hypothetical protein
MRCSVALSCPLLAPEPPVRDTLGTRCVRIHDARHVVALIVATAILAAAVAAVLVALAAPQRADAAASNAGVVRQLKKLKKLNSNVTQLNRNLGTSKFAGLRNELDNQTDQLHSDLADTCRALGGNAVACPDFSRRN